MNYYEVKVKSYENSKEFDKDAKRMARDGWTVSQVTSQQPRPGIGRIVLLGIFAGVFKPKPILVVTYQKGRE